MADKILKFKTPASSFGNNSLEGLVTGNGKTIINSTGGVFLNEINFFNNSLFAGGKRGVLPDLSDSVRAVQRYIKEKNKIMAELELSNALAKKGYNVSLPNLLTLTSLVIKTHSSEKLTNYERTLNLSSGEIGEYYKTGNTKYTRRCFVSRVNNFFVLEITKQGEGKIDTCVNLDITNGQVKYESSFAISSAKNDDGTEYGTILKVERTGGTLMTNLSGGIKIEGADKVFVIGKCFISGNKDKEYFSIKNELNLNKLTYEKLLKEHSNEHNKLFSETDLNLSENNSSYVEDLLSIQNDSIPVELIEKLWNFGKFLTVIQYNQDGLVFNPHLGYSAGFSETSGIFSDDILKRVYSGLISLNSEKMLLNLFNYYEKNYDDLKKNASRLYSSRGIMCSGVSSNQTAISFATGKNKINNLNITADISNLFYAYYYTTKDDKFLKTRALPFMKDAAIFYADLIEKDIYFGNYFKSAKLLFKNFIFESGRLGINKVELNIVKDADSKLKPEMFTANSSENKVINLIDDKIIEAEGGNLANVSDAILDVIKYSMNKNLSVLESNFDGSFNGEIIKQPKVRLDGNVGLTTLISNIFVNSAGNTISINPAHKLFSKFEVNSFLTENGYEISMDYNQKSGLNVKLKSRTGGLILVKLPDEFKKVKGSVEEDYDPKEKLITLNLAPGKSVSFSIM